MDNIEVRPLESRDEEEVRMIHEECFPLRYAILEYHSHGVSPLYVVRYPASFYRTACDTSGKYMTSAICINGKIAATIIA